MRNAIRLGLGTIIGLSLAGAAMAESRTFDLSGFDKVDIATGLDAVIGQGDDFAVNATSANADALNNLELTVVDGTLRARLDQNFLDFIFSGGLVGMLLSSGNAVSIEVTLPTLAGIDASSGADVRAHAVTSDQLDLNASSGANIEVTEAKVGSLQVESSSGADLDVSGTAESIDANASSGADIDAADLVAARARANASSGAGISINATDSVTAEASSGGDIEVHGNPTERDVDASSGGDVNFED